MKLFFHAVLVILFLLAVGAGAVASAWRWAPDRIAQLDAAIVRRYVSAPTDEIARLTRLAADSPEAALPEISEYAEELKIYRTRDRRFRQRLLIARLKATTLLALGRHDESAAVARDLAEISSFHHENIRWVARHLLGMGPPHAVVGLQIYRDLFADFPEDALLARSLSEALSAADDPEAALDVVLAHLKAVQHEVAAYEQVGRSWSIKAANDLEGLTDARSIRVLAADLRSHLVYQATVSRDVRFLRMTPPSRARAAFRDPLVSIATGTTREYHGGLNPLSPQGINLEVNKLGVVLRGHRSASLTFEIPPPTVEGEERVVQVGFPTNRFPKWLEEHLVIDAAAPKIDAVRAAASDSLEEGFFAERVLATRAYALSDRGIHVHGEEHGTRTIAVVVQDRQPRRPVLTERSSHDLSFSCDLTFGDTDAPLELEVPAVAGLLLQIDEVQCLDATGQAVESAGLAISSDGELVAVDEASRTWRVQPGAKAPKLRLERPVGSRAAYRLQGGLR